MADKKEKTSFTDAELEEFRILIEDKIKEARIDLELLNNELSLKDDHGTNDTGRTFNMMEDSASTFSREMNAQKASRQDKFVQSLENALMRIRNKTYGVCRVTGKLINKKRLMLVPHATLSIEAKNQQQS
ncbi:MAG: TraR/DksA family transcriptional regulator [Flavobacteriales bacterium]|jgi:DnaK suppressor protein|nr:TraR/DksA family transcriptional regulator [Flavobacteriales bacterium]|tara:strand:+ start:181 stop:570 length:390 start_codon:yes stop_codon:yes gene_type:complete